MSKYQIAWADSGDGPHQMTWDETVASLIAVVKDETSKGFEPQGGIGVIQSGDRLMLLQPMVRPETSMSDVAA